ncbi:MAG: hypothetical protein U0821_18440 [Chloroflexota bacterium]
MFGRIVNRAFILVAAVAAMVDLFPSLGDAKLRLREVAVTTRERGDYVLPLAVERAAWAHPEITYRIEVGSGVHREAPGLVIKAIESWNEAFRESDLQPLTRMRLVPLREQERDEDEDVDIHIVLSARESRYADGMTHLKVDSSGAIQSVRILILGRDLGARLDRDKVHTTAVHELGHALGLEHATWSGDPMHVLGEEAWEPSECNLAGVALAHAWMLDGEFRRPTRRRVVCEIPT